jgi:hypothetical protein
MPFYLSPPLEFCTVLNQYFVECICVLILFDVDTWDKISTMFILVLGLGVLKLFITLNSYDWLRIHSVLDSISMVHQSSSNVCDPLFSAKAKVWKTCVNPINIQCRESSPPHPSSLPHEFCTVLN